MSLSALVSSGVCFREAAQRPGVASCESGRVTLTPAQGAAFSVHWSAVPRSPVRAALTVRPPGAQGQGQGSARAAGDFKPFGLTRRALPCQVSGRE